MDNELDFCSITIFVQTIVKDNVIKDKSFGFALRVVKLYKYLTTEKKEYVLSKQLLRSGTSVGAMVREAEQAESKADFIHKTACATFLFSQK